MADDADRSRSRRPQGSAALEVDFALVLARLIELTKSDPARLRASVYDLARQKLRAQIEDDDPREQRRMLEALETAIVGVESFSEKQDDRIHALGAPDRRQLDRPRASELRSEVVPATHEQEVGKIVVLPPEKPERRFDQPATVVVRKRSVWRSFVPLRAITFLVLIAAIVSSAVYLQRHPNVVAVLRKLSTSKQAVVTPPVAAPTDPSAANAPPSRASASTAPVAPKMVEPARSNDPLLPTTFGVFAVSGGQLMELDQLPGRVPDQRVAMSSAITSPSRTILPDGKARFIVYRRDSAGSAPDRAEVRVIATVKSAMTFDAAGKPKVATTPDVWVIRNIAFNYRVGPVKDNADMYEIRNESEQFTLSPGRYALVVKGVAYDFVVAGPVTDKEQCLERIEAANGAFYSPCAKT